VLFLQLYIGNLTPGAVTDAMLTQVFDSALIAAFPQAAAPGQEPVCRVSSRARCMLVLFGLQLRVV
jgi:hypothetical protein